MGLLDVEEDRGGWGEWVPLGPDTPQPPDAAAEAAEEAHEVSTHYGHVCLSFPCTICSLAIAGRTSIKRNCRPQHAM